jgi:DNA processing protein
MDYNHARSLLFALQEMEGIGWKTIEKLVTRMPAFTAADIKKLNKARMEEWGIDASKAQRILDAASPDFASGRLLLYKEREIGYLTFYDDDYPPLLKQLAQPPWVLYYRGSLSCLSRPLLGMVGTRSPTVYGKKVAEELAYSLASCGFGIVSGLARGIDSSSHTGALKGAGGTIAVLGCAIDQVYPPENATLYKQIMESGLIISEYGIGTPSHPGLFPQRNRIISGLSLGVVVVEAAQKSGSLITADQALEQSRDVFAVPGPITSPKSRGTLELIKQGAKMVISPIDILEEYGSLTEVVNGLNGLPAGQESSVMGLTKEEVEIYQMLSHEPTTFDDLIGRSQFTFGHLHAVLLSLLLKKKIKQLLGSAYVAM